MAQELETQKPFDLLNARLDDEAIKAERGERLTMLTSARKYYDGLHPRHLKARKGEFDPNITINFCRSIVNKSVAWLFGDPESGEFLDFDLQSDDQAPESDEDTQAVPGELGGGQSDNADAEAWLKTVWLKNGGARLLQRLGRRGAIGGHVFVKIVPSTDPANDTGLPRIVAQKSEMVYVLTRADDDDVAEAYVIEWSEMQQVSGRAKKVKVRQIIASLDQTGTAPGNQWWVGKFADTGRGKNKWIETEPAQAWPFSWCPIIDWQNQPNDDGYYGLSDLEDLTPINDAINFAISNINKILYIHGHPRTIAIGIEPSDIQDTAVDNLWSTKNEKANIKNLEMQSDLSSAFNFLQFLSQAFWDIGRDMDLTSLQDRIGQVTNFGLRVLASAALEKLGEKRLNYGEGIDRINRALLELGGFPALNTVINWKTPLPDNAGEEVKRLQTEVDMKICSRETATQERGRDYETEQERIAKEEQGQGNIGAALLSAFEKGGPVSPLRSSLPPQSVTVLAQPIPAGPAQLSKAGE